MVDPLVSILIPCYNQGRYLADSVGSALGQTHPRVEVVIVDDGSTDDTRERAEALAAEYAGRVKVIHQENAGQARARAAGLAEARGDYVVFLDADDRLEPKMAETALAAFAGAGGADAVVGNAYLAAADGEQILSLHKMNEIVGWPEVLDHNPYGACFALMLRAEALRAVGGPAVGGVSGCEDWDLWARMTRCGMKFVAVDEPMGRYRQTATSWSRNALAMLRSNCDLLAQAAGEDERLKDCGRTVAPPISPDEHARLRNTRVFYFLGVALGANLEFDTVLKVIDHMVPGGLDAERALEQFAWGLQYAQLSGPVKPLSFFVRKKKVLRKMEEALFAAGPQNEAQKILGQFRRVTRDEIERRSLILRALNRVLGG